MPGVWYMFTGTSVHLRGYGGVEHINQLLEWCRFICSFSYQTILEYGYGGLKL